jgi:superfamily II DNA/RNA helicase
MSFSDLGLSEPLLKAIAEKGYTTPTAVQSQAIPIILMGRDILGFAPTGTGKTAGFVLPMLDILDSGRHRARMPRSIILSPTRELATQIAENFDMYGKHSSLTKALLIGGVGFEEQENLLDRGVDVLIATPGRLMDHYEKGRILLNDVKILVIDEADRMLDMGFIPDIEKIVALLPKIRQTLMFSATMPNEILRLANQFLLNPKKVEIARPTETAATVEQFFLKVPNDFKQKRLALRDALRHLQVRNAYVFCNRKKDVDVLSKSLVSHGFKAGAMHGDMDQFERNKTFDAFKSGAIDLLICSDVAARGLDVMDVSHVINFDVPWSLEDYIHRIGRTGRAGKSGCALMLVSNYEEKLFDPIQKYNIDRLKPLPLEVAVSSDSGANDDADGNNVRHHNRQARGKRQPHGRRQPGAGGEAKPARAKQPPAKRPARQAENPTPLRQSANTGEREQFNAQPRGERQQDDNGPPAKGMGPHVPAFLLRK